MEREMEGGTGPKMNFIARTSIQSKIDKSPLTKLPIKELISYHFY